MQNKKSVYHRMVIYALFIYNLLGFFPGVRAE